MQSDLQLGVGDRSQDFSPAQASARLEEAYGPLPPVRKRDPVSQLVRSVIASRAVDADAVSDAVLARLRERFGRWEALAGARADEVLAVIAPAAFAEEKAELLPQALAAVRRRMGALRLDGLAQTPVHEALDWLRTLPGVDQEVAASVLNASTLNRPVMIVDGHGLRVAVRLGWTPPPGDAGAARRAVMAVAPSSWTGEEFLAFHRRLKRLGQIVCRPYRPDCAACPLGAGCPQGRGSHRPEPGEDMEPIGRAALRRRLRRLDREAAPRERRTASLGLAALDAAFTLEGLPAGLHQFAPAAPTALASAWLAPVAVAARRPSTSGGVRVVLVQEADARREGGAPYGPGLEALGVAAADIAVVHSRSALDALGATEAALRLHAAPVVMLELRRGEAQADLAATRRLDLLARRAGAWLFLLTPTLHATSAALTRWRVHPAASPGVRRRPGPPAVRLELLRNRAGRTGAWTLLWNPHERRFTPVAPLSAPVGAPALDRSRAPDAERVAAAA